MRSFRPAAAVAAVLAVALAACSSGGGDTGTKDRQDGTTTTTAPPISPLTGLADPSGQSLARPVLWVKVENLDSAEVRPQIGLEVADVVYEEVVEGEITRFVAAFNSTVPDVVGPIRSVRLTDPNVVWPLGGIFAYSGGATPAVDAINQAPVTTIDESNAGDAMFRDPTRSDETEHTLFGRGANLFAKGGQPIPPSPLFQYLGPEEAFGGEIVTEFTVGFANGANGSYAPTYTFDPASNAWNRAIGGVPFTMASGTQIAPTNVIVQFTDYVGGVGIEGSEGVTVGEGDAWVFSNGQLVRGRWVRPDQTRPPTYVDAAGKPIKLAPGRTWVELLPIGAPVDLVQPPPVAPGSVPVG